MERISKRIRQEINDEEVTENDELAGKFRRNDESYISGFSIGTPATRAETIKELKDIGYIKTKGKSLNTTELGRTIVEVFPAKELLDLEYTGRLEKTLSDIEKGFLEKRIS